MTRTVLLGDLVRNRWLVYGDGNYSSKYPKASELLDTGQIPFISGKNLSGGRVLYENLRYISPELHAELKKGHIKTNDTLLVTRAGVGEVAYVSEDFDDANINAQLVFLRPDGIHINHNYLYQLFSSNLMKKRLISHSSGSAQGQLPIRSLLSVKIDLPDIETQKKIADILGTIDEKIELNRRMNETLEQMGQSLFRHYFIDNPEAEKWGVRTLGEFFPVKTGKKDANFSTDDGKYPFFTCAQAISKAPDFSFDAHALLLAGNGDFNLKLYRGKFEAYQRTYVLIPYNEELVGLLYFLMSMKLGDITGGSRGSVIKFITKGMIEGYKFKLPNDGELIKMASTFNQLTLNIEENVKEIQTLTALRDTLLPRLISGKIEVR